MNLWFKCPRLPTLNTRIILYVCVIVHATYFWSEYTFYLKREDVLPGVQNVILRFRFGVNDVLPLVEGLRVCVLSSLALH